MDEPRPLLTDEQRVRTLALAMAKPLLTGTSAFAGKTPPDVGDLITLATWIVEGGDDSPLYPFQNGETTVLGPGIFASHLGGTINWLGVNYVPAEEDRE